MNTYLMEQLGRARQQDFLAEAAQRALWRQARRARPARWQVARQHLVQLRRPQPVTSSFVQPATQPLVYCA